MIIITVPLILFLSCLLLVVPLPVFTVCSFCFYRIIGNHRFFSSSGVEHVQHNQDQFRFHRTGFYSQLKSKVGNILVNVTTLCINLNIESSMTILCQLHSHTGTHPSHSQTVLFSVHFPLLRYPLPSLDLVCPRRIDLLQIYLLVSHHVDTPSSLCIPPRSLLIPYI